MKKPNMSKRVQMDEILRIKLGVANYLANTNERTNIFSLARRLDCSPQKLSAVLASMAENSSLIVRLRIKYRIYR